MLMYTKRDFLDDAGDFYCAFGWGIARGKGRPKQEYETADQIFSACGGAAIYQTEMVRLIGGFDEAHFAYLEDMDPVSYTHLDVYKRQILFSTLCQIFF